VKKKLRVFNDRELQNIHEIEINEILSRALVKPAEILNPFSLRFSSFFDFALLGFPDRTPIEPLGN
jgi:hypothetical protein